MAVAKIDCPECGATLKPAKPLTPGKKVRCPKCDNVFVVPGSDEEEQEAPARKAKTAVSKAGRKSTPAEEPAPPPKKQSVDDEDAGGVYGVIQEPDAEKEEDEESKPKVEYAPDLSVKNPRGPATAALAVPSNGILGFGALMALLSVVTLCITFWPFLFTKWSSGVLPSDAKKKYELAHPRKGNTDKGTVKRDETSFVDEDQIMDEMQKSTNKELLAKWNEMVEEDRINRFIAGGCCIAALFYFVIMAYAGVILQNLESVRWSWTASIMAMFCIVGLPLGAWGYLSNEEDSTFLALGTFFLGALTAGAAPFGLWSLFLLKKPETVEAFQYEPD
jgi:hypothetical protein